MKEHQKTEEALKKYEPLARAGTLTDRLKLHIEYWRKTAEICGSAMDQVKIVAHIDNLQVPLVGTDEESLLALRQYAASYARQQLYSAIVQDWRDLAAVANGGLAVFLRIQEVEQAQLTASGHATLQHEQESAVSTVRESAQAVDTVMTAMSDKGITDDDSTPPDKTLFQ